MCFQLHRGISLSAIGVKSCTPDSVEKQQYVFSVSRETNPQHYITKRINFIPILGSQQYVLLVSQGNCSLLQGWSQINGTGNHKCLQHPPYPLPRVVSHRASRVNSETEGKHLWVLAPPSHRVVSLRASRVNSDTEFCFGQPFMRARTPRVVSLKTSRVNSDTEFGFGQAFSSFSQDLKGCFCPPHPFSFCRAIHRSLNHYNYGKEQEDKPPVASLFSSSTTLLQDNHNPSVLSHWNTMSYMKLTVPLPNTVLVLLKYLVHTKFELLWNLNSALRFGPSYHTKTLANASAPALAMYGFEGWKATS